MGGLLCQFANRPENTPKKFVGENWEFAGL
jgi:hypothetical protein